MFLFFWGSLGMDNSHNSRLELFRNFDDDEIDILITYGRSLVRLALGNLPPSTPDQHHFVSVFRDGVPAVNKYECALLKYLKFSPEIAGSIKEAKIEIFKLRGDLSEA